MDSSFTPRAPDSWTPQQNKRFEQALALYCGAEEEQQQQAELGGTGPWKKVAAMVPGKSPADVQRHYTLLLEDVAAIEGGKVAMPNYRSDGSGCSPTASWDERLSKGGASAAVALYAPKPCATKTSEQERKKGIPWTEEEHRLFLLGLEKFGKGDWRSISRNFVVSRTPTQVASHAQKYFIRLNSINKDKRRSSIHDITNASSPPPPSAPAFSCPLPPLPTPFNIPPSHPALHHQHHP